MNSRDAALQALTSGESAKAAVSAALSKTTFDARDRALTTELVNGTIKMRRALASALRPHLHRALESLDAPLRWGLLMGAYQLLYLDKLPSHAAVNETVAAVRRRGHAGMAALANAVLRKIAADPRIIPEPGSGRSAEALALWASLPDWIAQHFIERFGYARAVEVARGLNGSPRRALRVNTVRWSPREAQVALAERGFVVHAGAYVIPECLILREAARGDRAWLSEQLHAGALTLQSEESQFAVHALDPKPGDTVLDVCAGRGTKTVQIAARLRGEGAIVSVDDDERKLGQLRATVARDRLVNVAHVLADARMPFPSEVSQLCDVALVDAPCSGLGILGRQAEARWRKKPTDPGRFAKVQAAILRNAADHVRDGGRLLYVTCSTHPAEDEAVVNHFLAERRSWRPATRIRTSPSADIVTIDGSFLLTVPGVGGNDGFFYALLERRGTDE